MGMLFSSPATTSVVDTRDAVADVADHCDFFDNIIIMLMQSKLVIQKCKFHSPPRALLRIELGLFQQKFPSTV